MHLWCFSFWTQQKKKIRWKFQDNKKKIPVLLIRASNGSTQNNMNFTKKKENPVRNIDDDDEARRRLFIIMMTPAYLSINTKTTHNKNVIWTISYFFLFIRKEIEMLLHKNKGHWNWNPWNEFLVQPLLKISKKQVV